MRRGCRVEGASSSAVGGDVEAAAAFSSFAKAGEDDEEERVEA